jgi:hypothetical protein
VIVRGNTAGAIGGGYFRVSNSDDGTMAIDRSTRSPGWRQTSSGTRNAGGLYLQGLALTVTNTTISRNIAGYGGGIWINECQLTMTNTTIAENEASVTNGGGVWLGNTVTGTMKNVTIANNHSTKPGNVAGGIFGSGLTLVNTLIANNTAQYNPTCDQQRTDGSGNLQFPNSSLCTTSPLTMDPMLGALQDNGGDNETMLPAIASPARGIATNCPPLDQLGKARPEPCTAGAVEAILGP